jgi:hypothetical protein
MAAHSIPRAKTDWRKLWVDATLLVLAVAFMLLSYRIDVSAGRADWFHRSGAVAVLLSGVLGVQKPRQALQEILQRRSTWSCFENISGPAVAG